MGDATLYCGDCLRIPGLSSEIVLSDPPYGIDHKVRRAPRLGKSKWDRQKHVVKILGDSAPFDPSPWIQGKAILWGANHYADRLAASAGWLVWDKRDVGTHNKKFIASDCELAWSNVLGSVKIFSHLWAGLCRDSEVGDHFHPTQKPVALMQWCLQFLPEGPVLDPYMGSGSTGVACASLGRSFVGVEIDPNYFEIAVKRVRAAYAQGRLFP